MRRPSLRHVAIAIALLAVGALLVGAWSPEGAAAFRAERGELRQAVVASGRVRTPQRVEIAAQVTGRVAAVAVREGERVEPGQMLVRLDDAEARAAAEQARATLAQGEARLRQLAVQSRPAAEQALRQAEANRLQAERHYERVRELVARNFYSQAQLDDARRALEVADSQRRSAELQLTAQAPDGAEAAVARSGRDQARAALAVAEARLGYAALRSPVAGTVLTRSVEPGDTVQPGRVLLTLAPDGATELSAQIDEKNLALLAVGQTARVSADAYAGRHFAAEVSYIAPSVDAQRGSVEIRLRVHEPPAYLKHEMTVSIDVETGRRAEALIVPADCLRDADGAPWLLVVRDGVAERRPVRVGLRGAGRVEIVDGLNDGEAVLPAASPVAAGRRVRAEFR